MTLSMVISIILAVGSGLGIGGNFRGAQQDGLNGSETQTTSKGINPVQHSE